MIVSIVFVFTVAIILVPLIWLVAILVSLSRECATVIAWHSEQSTTANLA